MGLQVSQTLVLTDKPVDFNTFAFGGTDRIDLTAIGGDVAIELSDPMGSFSYGPLIVIAGTEESINGLATAYPASRGVRRFRIYKASAGSPASAKLRAWGV